MRAFRHLLLTLAFAALILASHTVVGQTLYSLTAGWNLMGNAGSTAIDVASTFGDSTKFVTVWKWNSTTSKWALYVPSMTAATLASYNQGKGYDTLATIGSKEGFWVNASVAGTFMGPLATPPSPGAPAAALNLLESDLKVGWNLVASADNKAPTQLNAGLTSSLAANSKAINAIWAWDAQRNNWRFYAPSLEAQGGTSLTDYITSHAYESFTAPISNADGFWVNVDNSTPKSTSICGNQTSVGLTAGQAVIDLGLCGKLISPVQVDGGKWYYYWDRSGDGTSANTGPLNGGTDLVSHDTLNAIFNQDVNGVVGGGGETTETYRFATLNGVRVALPTLGGGVTTPPTGPNGANPGTVIGSAVASAGSNATNPTYHDYLAIWDAYNGTGTGFLVGGVPPGWADGGDYWSATESYTNHAVMRLTNAFGNGGSTFNNTDDKTLYPTALQVIIYQIGGIGPAGGIVIYLDNTGNHGIEVAPVDLGPVSSWGCFGKTFVGATATAIGAGKANTIAILNNCADQGIAARVAADYSLNGYIDWYLPSKDELQAVWSMASGINFVGFSNLKTYWASTDDGDRAWFMGLGSESLGRQYEDWKWMDWLYVRPVRSF